MNLQMPNWLSGLGQSGWVAIFLLIAFAVITAITIFMIWKLMRQTHRPAAPGKDIETPPPAPRRAPAPKKAPETAEEPVDPVAEAEVFLTYGLHKQAINVLEKHLVENPSDSRASKMLNQARKKSRENSE